MDDRHRKALRESRVFVVKNLKNVGDVCDFLLTTNTLTDTMMENIMEGKSTRTERVRELLDTITCRGPNAFQEFLNALIDTNNEHVYKKLIENVDPSTYHARSRTQEDSAASAALSSVVPDILSEQGAYLQQPSNDLEDLPREWPENDICQKNVNGNYTLPPANPRKKKQPYYNLDGSNYRGRVLIINNFVKKNFIPLDLKEREGTQYDADGLNMLFAQMNYDVVIKQDLTKSELTNIIEEEKRKCFETKCFIIFLLSHGCESGIYCVDGNIISEVELKEKLNGQNFPELHDKPKLFFIQACKGKKFDDGASGSFNSQLAPSVLARRIEALSLNVEMDSTPASEPTYGHFFFGWSTTDEMVSFRHKELGSYFIQALIFVIRVFGHDHCVDSVMTKVKNLVSKGRYRKKHLTTAESRTTLSKSFYFY